MKGVGKPGCNLPPLVTAFTSLTSNHKMLCCGGHSRCPLLELFLLWDPPHVHWDRERERNGWSSSMTEVWRHSPARWTAWGHSHWKQPAAEPSSLVIWASTQSSKLLGRRRSSDRASPSNQTWEKFTQEGFMYLISVEGSGLWVLKVLYAWNEVSKRQMLQPSLLPADQLVRFPE